VTELGRCWGLGAPDVTGFARGSPETTARRAGRAAVGRHDRARWTRDRPWPAARLLDRATGHPVSAERDQVPGAGADREGDATADPQSLVGEGVRRLDEVLGPDERRWEDASEPWRSPSSPVWATTAALDLGMLAVHAPPAGHVHGGAAGLPAAGLWLVGGSLLLSLGVLLATAVRAVAPRLLLPADREETARP
jgi:hypothetical protein